MRIRYCWTSSFDVTRPCSIAARISGIVASTTVNGRLVAAPAAGFVVCAAATATPAAAVAAAASIIGFIGVIINESGAGGVREGDDEIGGRAREPRDEA